MAPLGCCTTYALLSACPFQGHSRRTYLYPPCCHPPSRFTGTPCFSIHVSRSKLSCPSRRGSRGGRVGFMRERAANFSRSTTFVSSGTLSRLDCLWGRSGRSSPLRAFTPYSFHILAALYTLVSISTFSSEKLN